MPYISKKMSLISNRKLGARPLQRIVGVSRAAA